MPSFISVFFAYTFIVSWLLPARCAKAQSTAGYVFPLKISADARHLSDQRGKPFLYHADTGWMLLLNLTKPEALAYLTDRKAKGFNAIQVQLTGFMAENGQMPKNRDGETPFVDTPDFSQPNEAYFQHVDWVVRQADSLGLVLAIAPLWYGCCGEGWAGKDKPMQQNGVQKTHQLGKYLGKRYGKYSNVLWIMGGDNDPHEDRDAIRQLALGIQQTAPHQLITYHAASTHSSTDVWPNEPWLSVVMIYTYFRGFNKAWNKNQPDVYEAATAEYRKKPIKPFFLGESTYEGEHGEWGSALQVRKQAYWAILSGSTGHAYGSPLWRFDDTWRRHLDLPGARSLPHWYTLFTSRAWEKLVPDDKNLVAVDGRGKFASNDYAVTALATDGSFAVSYLPTKRTISLNLRTLKPSQLRASWFNPRTGKTTFIGSYRNRQTESFTSPDNEDWVLLIEKQTR